MIAKLAELPLSMKKTDKVQNGQMAKLRLVLIVLILLVKKLFHNNSVLMVDTAVYLTQMNCAYLLARYRTYELTE